jgi:hypothetical protein
MLADERPDLGRSGGFAPGLHRSATWINRLIEFIAEQLPIWRDRKDRPPETSETQLTSRLCAHLNSASRKSDGWDLLQFRMEEPDTVRRERRIDLAVAPAGEVIWIDGRRYSDFDPILPIECKRLPTPPGTDRDKREYLRVAAGTTGGVQRFKAGLHGAGHRQAAMIGYVQAQGLIYWIRRIDLWVRAFARAKLAGWQMDDRLRLDVHDKLSKVAVLHSEHARAAGLPVVALTHLWIEI